MRAEGHSRENVTEVIRRYGLEWREEEKRDWRRYAGRTANYAFGMAGDMELAKSNEILWEQKRNIKDFVEIRPEISSSASRMRMR
jgi:hypothetical protein